MSPNLIFRPPQIDSKTAPLFPRYRHNTTSNSKLLNCHCFNNCLYDTIILQIHWKCNIATLQIRIDDAVKKQADTLFSSLGLDTSTAIRIFLNAAIENAGIPFSVQHRAIPYQLQEAVYDSRFRRDLNGPFDNAEDAVASMLED